MEFYNVVGHVRELLQQHGRLTYRGLKRQFRIDDDYIEDLKNELIYAQQVARDEDHRVLVWIGDTNAIEPTPVPTAPEFTTAQPAEPEQAPASYTPAYLAEKILTSKQGLEGERKIVTVVFADIKDSTELIRDLDPEDAQKLLDPAIHIMMEAVHRFEGTVNQVLGDGIMSIFGAPIAHEDHAARACYAALAMQAAMQDYTDEVRRRQGLELRIRVGLNSGEVVVRTIGNDLHMDYSAVGPTTHLAARMEQLASPGTIRLPSSTLRLVEGLVQVHDLGPIPVKGMDEPVEVYELTGASTVRRRLQAAVARGLTKFVGRDTEIEALNQALEQAGSGNGQIVAAVGEAGVGKSRLTYEFVHSHRTQEWRVLESASVSYGKATPYFPVIDLLKRYIHAEDGDDARTIRAKVTGQVLTLDESLQDTIPALLSLLDTLPEDSPFLDLDPPQRRQRTLDGLKRILLRESQVQPLVLVFEDLHWHDRESQALLDGLVESLPTNPLLLLVNYRPEYTHNWGGKTFYAQLRLDPLPPESSDELLEALLGNDNGLKQLKKLLIERTEGNPFFLEESVRTLVETQVVDGEPGLYRLVHNLPTIQVPPTVQAVLAARIDRLSEEEKRLLQTASVIGTEVSFTLLQAIAEIPDESLYPCLTYLQAAEFLYEISLFPERVFMFKHALTHEVAYGSLLQERRRVLHARIFETLEALGGDRLSEQVERLAHHAMRGEVWDKALTYFRQAGNKAMVRSAAQEALASFEQALEAIAHLPDNPDVIEQAIDLRLELSSTSTLFDVNRRMSYLREAEQLAEHVKDDYRLARIWSSQAHYFFMAGDHSRAIEACERALSLTLQDGNLHAGLNFILGNVHYALGDYRQAIDILKKNVESMQGNDARERVLGSTGSRPVHSRARLVWCLLEVGEFAEGIVIGDEALRIAEEVNYPFSRVIAYLCAGVLYLRKGEVDKSISILERAMMLCQTLSIPAWYPAIPSALACAYSLVGRMADALPLLEQGLAWATSKQIIVFRAFAMLCQGEAALRTARYEDANTLTAQVLSLVREHQERGHQAWALRLLGEIARHRKSSDIEQAETHYQQALTIASELGMRPLQAHCHRGLGTLYSQTGQSEQARAELSTAIEMYRDMEMTFWLPETEAALAAVEVEER